MSSSSEQVIKINILLSISKKKKYHHLLLGTAGTISGIGRKIKEKNPDVKIIAVDPYGSVLAMPQQLNSRKEPHDVEGIGKDFIPKV